MEIGQRFDVWEVIGEPYREANKYLKKGERYFPELGWRVGKDESSHIVSVLSNDVDITGRLKFMTLVKQPMRDYPNIECRKVGCMVIKKVKGYVESVCNDEKLEMEVVDLKKNQILDDYSAGGIEKRLNII